MADFRKLILRLLLIALAIAAVAGAGTVLMSNSTAGWRIVGTALVTAGAAALMIPVTLLADRERTRLGALFGIVAVIVEYFLALALIWNVAPHADEELALTMCWLAVCGVTATLVLALVQSPASAVVCIVGSTISTIAFTLFMIGTWGADRWRDQSDWFEIATAVLSFGLLATAALAGPKWRWWNWVGVIACTLATTIATYAIWFHINSDSPVFAIIVSVAVVVAHANLCLLVPLTGGQRWIRIVTIIATLACAGIVDLIIATTRSYSMNSPIDNLAGATGIIAGCGSLALLVLARLNRAIDRSPVSSEIREISLQCPMCQKKQTMPIAKSNDAPPAACVQCGLKIRVQVDLPACAKCGYLLVLLNSDRCPECGEPVGAAPALS